MAVVEPPRSTALRWQTVTRYGLDADLVLVNTKGLDTWFDLVRGRATAGDVPLLERPAAVHFIHSFSARRPANASTVAGAWLDRGAFAYIGSVHEPYLGAFVPHGAFASRFAGGMPWGAAGRHLSGRFAEAWKVNVFGDPLFGFGAARRLEGGGGEGVDVGGGASLEAALRAAAGEGASGEALRLLVMSGRWGDAVDLVSAMLGDDEGDGRSGGGIGAGVARLGLAAAYFEGRADVAAGVFEASPSGVRDDPTVLAMLWGVLRHELGADTGRYTGLLMANPRAASLVQDADALAPHVRRVFGEEAVVRMYGRFASMAPDDRSEREVLDAAPASR
jgi:hypothetical protein